MDTTMATVFILFSISLLLIGWSIKWFADPVDRFVLRIPQTIGSIAAFSGFFFFGWVKFAPLDFAINVIPDLFEDSTLGFLRWLLNLLGDVQAARFLSWITALANLPGWLLFVLIPSAQPLLRILLFSIGLFSFFYVLWAAAALILDTSRFVHTVNIFFACTGFIQALLLVYLLPSIDSWGSAGTLWPALSALLFGVQMGSGVWITLFGLTLSSIGNLNDVIANRRTTPNAMKSDETASYSSFYNSY